MLNEVCKIKYIETCPMKKNWFKIDFPRNCFILVIESSIHIQNSKLSHGFFYQSHISSDIYKFIYQSFGPKA
jgi:hypothetical protein